MTTVCGQLLSNGSLFINSTQLQDTGVYSCLVNSNEMVSATLTVFDRQFSTLLVQQYKQKEKRTN